MWHLIVIFLVIGAISGFASGLIGIGGGVLIVPALAYVFSTAPIPQNLLMHEASATSLGVIALMSQAAVYRHWMNDNIDWSLVKKLLPGVIIGVISGVLIADKLPTLILQVIFGLFLVAVSLKLLFGRIQKGGQNFPNNWLHQLITWIIGAKSGLLGLGGGAVSIPYLVYANVPMRRAIGVTTCVSFSIAMTGALVSMYTGSSYSAQLPTLSIGYVYLPAVLAIALPGIITVQLGVWVGQRTPTILLKRLFSVILLFLALHMLWR